MSQRNPRFYLDDILTSCSNIREFTKGISTAQDLERDLKTYHAVLRNIEVIGEACRQMPRKIKNKYPEIPWREIGDMRNFITHEYFGVDAEIAWQVCERYLPKLEKQIAEINPDVE
jgi:uncharacterized protein with HEPN domain